VSSASSVRDRRRRRRARDASHPSSSLCVADSWFTSESRARDADADGVVVVVVHRDEDGARARFSSSSFASSRGSFLWTTERVVVVVVKAASPIAWEQRHRRGRRDDAGRVSRDVDGSAATRRDDHAIGDAEGRPERR